MSNILQSEKNAANQGDIWLHGMCNPAKEAGRRSHVVATAYSRGRKPTVDGTPRAAEPRRGGRRLIVSVSPLRGSRDGGTSSVGSRPRLNAVVPIGDFVENKKTFFENDKNNDKQQIVIR